MMNSSKKKVFIKVIQFLILLLFGFYLGFMVGKDAALRDNRNIKIGNVNKD